MATLKLKHLTELLSDTPNYTKVMTEVCGFKNHWFGRKWVFIWKFKEAHRILKLHQNLRPKEVEENPDCKIKRPKNIDHITFMAMMDIHSMLNNPSDDIVDLFAELICKTCYSENNEGDYKANTEQYLDFKQQILDSPLLDMLGLYNWIDKSLNTSGEFWNAKFQDVAIDSKDFEMAGGAVLNNFNVLNSIKSLCNDFNLEYNKAWQMSYAMSQSNALAKATERYIQEQMRIIKEAEMKREQQKNKHR